ncbi:MAG: DUF2334 domain-containing protein [Actinomycetaceae bacterium]|nr:DUF2334 domain-containing protein [Actinomycetaceae bacterium]
MRKMRVSTQKTRFTLTSAALCAALALATPAMAGERDTGDTNGDLLDAPAMNVTAPDPDPAGALEGAQEAEEGTSESTLVTDNPLESPEEPLAAAQNVLPLEASDAEVDLASDIDTSYTPAPIRDLAASDTTVPDSAVTFGDAEGAAHALVLYDSTGDYAQLAESYAIGTSTLATHFGLVTAVPVADYAAGLAGRYDGVVYLGSTYDEPLPEAFVSDVLTGDVPVLWAGFNIWELAATDENRAAFAARYGWDAATSYIDSSDVVASITYDGQALTRDTANSGGIIAPHVTDEDAVTVLGTATCTSDGVTVQDCAPIAQTTGSSFPWAIRSGNLTYIGEIPLSYMSETDRYLAFSDLLCELLAPGVVTEKTAAIRIEDISPGTDAAELEELVDYLVGAGVPFQMAVVPYYIDPTGVYNNGVPEALTFADNQEVLAVIQYAQKHGGTVIQHGTTHQYGTLNNPYDAVSTDDFEFYRSYCTDTADGSGGAVACQDNSWVQLVGALPDDSAAWASERASIGYTELTDVGLGDVQIWETPHYAATAASYQGIGQVYSTRYERELFFPGQLNKAISGAAGHFGQFFPYTVSDIYGTKILPENLGNFEPEEYNNHAARTGQDLVENARANLVVDQGNASFFFHPGYPVSELQTAVEGIQGLGYTFVPATELN